MRRPEAYGRWVMEDVARMDRIGYIGEVHAHCDMGVGQTGHRKRIVEILGVGGVDREGRNAAEIPPGGDFVCGQLGRDFVGFLLHLFGIGIGKVLAKINSLKYVPVAGDTPLSVLAFLLRVW